MLVSLFLVEMHGVMHENVCVNVLVLTDGDHFYFKLGNHMDSDSVVNHPKSTSVIRRYV